MCKGNWFLPSGNINEILQDNRILLEKTEWTSCLDWQQLYFFSKNEIDFLSLSPQILLPDQSIPATSSPGQKPGDFHSVDKVAFCRGCCGLEFCARWRTVFPSFPLCPASRSDELQHLLQSMLAGVKTWVRRWTCSWVHTTVSSQFFPRPLQFSGDVYYLYLPMFTCR